MLPNLYNKNLSWSTLQPYLEECSTILKAACQNASTEVENHLSVKTPVHSKRGVSTERVQQNKSFNSLQTFSDELRKLSISLNENLLKSTGEFMSEQDFPQLIVNNLQCLNHMGVLRSNDVFYTALSLYSVALNMSDIASNFAIKLAEAGIMHLLHENVCLCRHPDYGQEASTKVRLLVKVSLGIMNNIVRRDGNKPYFLQEWALTLREVICLRRTETDRCLAAFILSYVLDDDNVGSILTMHCEIVSTLLNMTKQANKNVHGNRRCRGFSLEELLDVQASLTTHDKVKEEFMKHKGLEIMLPLCRKEYPKEAFRASQIICNLLFHPSLKETIKTNGRLETFLKQLMNDSWPSTTQNNIVMALWLLQAEKIEKPSNLSGSFKRVAQEAKIVAMTCKVLNSKVENVSSETQSETQVYSKLFISYCHADKPIVTNVSNHLIQAGYSVWLDDHQIQGNTMDIIAEAIEHASVVVICMSEAYKMSHYAEMEAKYACLMKKKLVFLVTQQHYHPTGWLGLLLSDHFYYDFSGRRIFDMVMNMLLKYLNEICPL